jgi:hypothetical protein
VNGHAASKSYRLPLVVAFTALALFAVLQRRLVESCRGGLVEVAEPDGWRQLPQMPLPNAREAMKLGHFAVRGEAMMPKYGLGFLNAQLYEPAYCRSAAVSLERWFSTGPEPSYSRNPLELLLRQDPKSGVYTVSGAVWGNSPSVLVIPEQHVVSFRSEAGFRLSWVSSTGRAIGLSYLSAALVAFASWAARSATRAQPKTRVDAVVRVVLRVALLVVALATLAAGCQWTREEGLLSMM